VVAEFDEFKKECGDDTERLDRKIAAMDKQATAEGKLPRVRWERIVDHIDHAVKLVGADHVGLSLDFDGADMPDGMEDCTHLPQITEALMRKGYSDANIRKILGENLLRVMEEAERVSHEMQLAAVAR
jgi:membrane dipeptidase